MTEESKLINILLDIETEMRKVREIAYEFYLDTCGFGKHAFEINYNAFGMEELFGRDYN